MNLVNECDNTDVPDYDYSTCENNVYMCCWSEREGGLVKNTVRSLLLSLRCLFLFFQIPYINACVYVVMCVSFFVIPLLLQSSAPLAHILHCEYVPVTTRFHASIFLFPRGWMAVTGPTWPSCMTFRSQRLAENLPCFSEHVRSDICFDICAAGALIAYSNNSVVLLVVRQLIAPRARKIVTTPTSPKLSQPQQQLC